LPYNYPLLFFLLCWDIVQNYYSVTCVSKVIKDRLID
jgi:hypothetical protein